MIKIADFGETFGMAVSPVFRPWTGTQYLDTRVPKARIAELVEEADLVLLGGGADIHPSLYGCRNIASGVGEKASIRDEFEVEVVKQAVKFAKPILGICRGAQMLCVQAGGKLVQHVDGHAGPDHFVHVPNYLQEPIETNSVHHQMMVPPKRSAHMLGWTEGKSERFVYDADAMEFDPHLIDSNPEIMFFTNIRGLAIQGHPEFYRSPQVPFVKLTRTLVQRILGINPDHKE